MSTDIHYQQIEQSLADETKPYFPPVVDNERDLLIEALRSSNRTSIILNMIRAELDDVLGEECDEPRWARLHALIRTQHNAASGLHLFIAANNMRLELPADLKEEGDGCPE